MKYSVTLVLLAVMCVGGCAKVKITRLEAGGITLDVKASITPAVGDQVAIADGQLASLGPVVFMLDPQNRQITIEARIVETRLDDMSILGLSLVDGIGNLISPTTTKNLTPKPKPISIGFGFGFGTSRGTTEREARHAPDCKCCNGSSGGSGVRTSMGGGMSFPIQLGSDNRILAVQSTFLVDDLAGILDDAYLLAMIQAGESIANEKVLVQPLL
ncbi:MAG TPA: hypothetical protein ENL03_00125, partial [Phycisphaerae bacterium]|nr:hypothetical protein [Phycisphaerae bacterium]